MKKDYNFIKGIILNCLLLFVLLIYSQYVSSQNLNFTIDTAVDNGVSITETLTSGGDTYVLLIDITGSGAETLFDLGGGDIVFYFGSSAVTNTFIVTLTKNGNPTNFKLDGIDYDTVEDGFISILNQDDAEISSNQEYLVGAGAIPITNATNAANITAIKIIQPDVSDNTDFAFHNINIDVLDTLSIENFIELGNEISIFPNPSNGNITIKNSGIVIDTVSVIDLNGRAITAYDLKGITSDKNLDLSSKLVSGMYFVSISSEKGIITKRIIIN